MEIKPLDGFTNMYLHVAHSDNSCILVLELFMIYHLKVDSLHFKFELLLTNSTNHYFSPTTCRKDSS